MMRLSAITGDRPTTRSFELHKGLADDAKVIVVTNRLRSCMGRSTKIASDGLWAHGAKCGCIFGDTLASNVELEPLPPYGPKPLAIEYLSSRVEQLEWEIFASNGPTNLVRPALGLSSTTSEPNFAYAHSEYGCANP